MSQTFSNVEVTHVSGKGSIALVRIPSDDPMSNTGDRVTINGKSAEVVAVEFSRILTNPSRRQENVGLVFKEIK